MKTRGRIHSYEVGSGVDGPGLRFVVFTQGCPLRCLYCHNPDTRDPLKGHDYSVEELFGEMIKYKSYFDNGHGGLTVTGGEPLLQPEFVASLLKGAQDRGIHTALDTSGFASEHAQDLVIPHADLVILDIKSFKPELYHKVTQVDLNPTLRLAQKLHREQKKFWVRFVLVPGLTNDPQNMQQIAEYCAPFNTLEKLEILPFHKLGEYKWEALGMNFQLKETSLPTHEELEEASHIFRSQLGSRFAEIQ